MQRLKQQLFQAQFLYNENRVLALAKRDNLLEVCQRITNETFMWAAPKQLLQEVENSCAFEDMSEDQISDLMKKNDKMIYWLCQYNQEFKKQEEK